MAKQSKAYWSNCLIEAVKAKLRSPSAVSLKFIFTAGHFHVMWHDKSAELVKHFTHLYCDGRQSDIWFEGFVESFPIERYNAYCQKMHVPHLMMQESKAK